VSCVSKTVDILRLLGNTGCPISSSSDFLGISKK
jgi:hypothetical protein